MNIHSISFFFLPKKILGVAVGSGWQSMVAYVNIGCYYFIGIPMGILLGWLFNLGVLVRCCDPSVLSKM
jgi:Na+-driven multidrug efflux pump